MSVNYYSIEEAFNEIEDELLTDLRKRLQKGIIEVDDIGEAYKIWQVEQLQGIQQFRYIDDKIFAERFSQLNDKVEQLLDESYMYANEKEARDILQKLSDRIKKPVNADELILLNKDKLRNLIKSTTNDLKRAEYATLRMCDDQYRKIIYNTQLYLTSDSGTLQNAIDRAKNAFYESGITSVQYKNGAQVNIASYSEMALRTANKRATLQGAAAARDEYGLNLVIITRRGTACPKCQQFCGRVCVDDVYGSVQNDNNDTYPLLSDFIARGLYHPNCKDSHSTYYPDVSAPPKPMTDTEQERATEIYDLEQKQRYNERQIRKYKRLAENQLDPANADKYDLKVKEWQVRQREFIQDNADVLRRKYDRESITVKKKYVQRFVTPAQTSQEAVQNLKDMGYNINEKQLLKVEDKTLKGMSDSLSRLENKYHLDLKTSVENTNRVKNYEGKMTGRFSAWDGLLDNINIQIRTNRTSTEIEGLYQRTSASGWHMPFKIGKELEYTPTHEYGHALEWDMARKASLTVEGQQRIANLIKMGRSKLDAIVEFEEWFNDDVLKQVKQIFAQDNPTLNFNDYLSRYGKSKSSEAFAELFANAELGNTNPAGKALMKFLRQKGYGV